MPCLELNCISLCFSSITLRRWVCGLGILSELGAYIHVLRRNALYQVPIYLVATFCLVCVCQREAESTSSFGVSHWYPVRWGSALVNLEEISQDSQHIQMVFLMSTEHKVRDGIIWCESHFIALKRFELIWDWTKRKET